MSDPLEAAPVLSLIAVSCLALFGLAVLCWIIVRLFSGWQGQGRLSRMAGIIGVFGLAGPAAVAVVSLINNNEAAEALVIPFWPTFFVLGAGENGDPTLYILLVFGVAVLSNVGLYAIVGLAVGAIWAWIRAKRADA